MPSRLTDSTRAPTRRKGATCGSAAKGLSTRSTTSLARGNPASGGAAQPVGASSRAMAGATLNRQGEKSWTWP